MFHSASSPQEPPFSPLSTTATVHRYMRMQIYSGYASVCDPCCVRQRVYIYTRATTRTPTGAQPSRACCRCSVEGHKLNDVNALSTLCRSEERRHTSSLLLSLAGRLSLSLSLSLCLALVTSTPE